MVEYWKLGASIYQKENRVVDKIKVSLLMHRYKEINMQEVDYLTHVFAKIYTSTSNLLLMSRTGESQAAGTMATLLGGHSCILTS